MRFTKPLLSTCLAAFIAAQAPAQSVTTDPVGFTAVTVPAAPNATTPSNTVVSDPLYTLPIFTGAVSGLSSNDISLTGANFSAGLLTAAPHLVKLKTGNSVGRFFRITAQIDQDTFTVDPAGYTLVSGAPAGTTQIQIANGDSAQVFPAHTLNSLFPNGAPFFKDPNPTAADNVYLFNSSSGAWEVYFHNNTSWRKSGNLQNQNNTIVYPDDGMFIVRRQTSQLTITFVGAVPTTPERTDIPGPGQTYIANRFPVGTTIVNTNIHNLPSWQRSTDVSVADNLYVWDPATSAFRVYFHNNTSWRRSGFLGNVDAETIPINGTIFVLRRSTASGTQSTLVQALPYTL